MTDIEDPRRLASGDSGEPIELERLAHALRGAELSEERIARIEARLGSVLDASLSGPRPTRKRTRWVAIVAIVMLVVGVSYAALRFGRVDRPILAPPPRPTAPEPRAPSPAPFEALSASEIPIATSAPSAPAHAAPKPTPPAGPSEDELLGRARAALGTSPATALGLAEEHARRFPRGALSPEREVIAIEALKRLGRDGDANARGERFLAAYPESIYRTKVEQVLGHAHATKP